MVLAFKISSLISLQSFLLVEEAEVEEPFIISFFCIQLALCYHFYLYPTTFHAPYCCHILKQMLEKLEWSIQQWTIQRDGQHCTQDTWLKQTKQRHNTQKLKKLSNTDVTKNREWNCSYKTPAMLFIVNCFL